MSLVELTRNCFQSGISAYKWTGLCTLFLTRGDAIHGLENGTDIEVALSNSVLVLYRSYPGDNDLQEYLKAAIQARMISISVFVSTLLQACRSPELHTLATLDMLCRVALDAHYSTELPPIVPVTSFSEIQDALALLRTAHSLPMSHFHQLATSASELFTLLLASAGDIPQNLTTAQAMVNFADANDMLQNFRLSPGVREILETFVITLSVVIGDDAQAREAQMHTVQLALGKGSADSDTDLVTFGLELNEMISNRAGEFGPGSPSSVAIFLSVLRWTAWAPVVFYTQLISASFVCLSQSPSCAVASLWRAFIVGRLPRLMVMFEQAVNADSTMVEYNWRDATATATAVFMKKTDLIARCDNVLFDSAEEEMSRSFRGQFLQQLLAAELIDSSLATSLDPTIVNELTPRLQSEAQDAGMDLDNYIETRLLDTNIDELRSFVGRLWTDPGSHACWAEVFYKKFISLTNLLDVEPFSNLCRMMYMVDAVMDILSLHNKVTDFVFYALAFLEGYDCETVGDPQSAVSQLGEVVLFLQFTLARYNLEQVYFTVGPKSLSSAFVRSTDVVHSVNTLTGDDGVAFHSWYKALFDHSSEGIEDTILRATPPQRLLRISATLFSRAISEATDMSVLTNGVSYFLGPLFNWTLVGVVRALIAEVEQKGPVPAHMGVLQNLILSESCPRPVLCLCGSRIIALMRQNRSVEADRIREAVSRAIGKRNEVTQSAGTWQDQPKQAIQDAFALARANKAPSLDVQRCLKITGTVRFLRLLWAELCVAASSGETDICKRISAFIFTASYKTSEQRTPPLLPPFFHSVLPSILSMLDVQDPPVQAMHLNLLATVVSSVLTAALNLEWSLAFVSPEQRHTKFALTMAKRLAAELRSKSSLGTRTGRMLGQRLGSSQSFIANFPAFVVSA